MGAKIMKAPLWLIAVMVSLYVLWTIGMDMGNMQAPEATAGRATLRGT